MLRDSFSSLGACLFAFPYFLCVSSSLSPLCLAETNVAHVSLGSGAEIKGVIQDQELAIESQGLIITTRWDHVNLVKFLPSGEASFHFYDDSLLRGRSAGRVLRLKIEGTIKELPLASMVKLRLSQPLPSPSPDLLLWLDFNRDRPLSADRSPLDHPVRFHDTEWLASHQGRSGVLHFKQAKAHLEIPHHERLQPQVELTMALWVWMEDWGTTKPMTLISKTESGGYSLGYRHSKLPGSTLFGCLAIADDYLNLSHPKIPSAGWHHLALTFDGQHALFYFDGLVLMRKDLKEVDILTYQVNNSLIIGGEAGAKSTPDPRYYFSGALDNIGMWQKALPASEILKLSQQ